MCSVRFTKCLFFQRIASASFTINFNSKTNLMNNRSPITPRNLAALFSLFSLTGLAQVTPALVDFEAYETLVTEVKEHRKTRLLSAQEFKTMSRQDKVIILDTRSDSMFAAVHVKGAIHLNFSDFTQANLQKIIPSPDYRILIYCNNNFISQPQVALHSDVNITSTDFSKFFPTKMAWPVSTVPVSSKESKKHTSKTKQAGSGGSLPGQFAPQISVAEKPLTLALNIPTYINLYGYGYRNVYELSELVNTYDSPLEFEGKAVK